MKRMLAVAALVVGFVAQSFATGKDENKVNLAVVKSFNNNFAEAENVRWKVGDNFVKASFELEGDNYEAFYSPTGDFMGTTKAIEYKKLPKAALKKLAAKYTNLNDVITESIIYTDVDGNSKYFVSLLVNGKKSILEIGTDGSVQPFKKS